MRCKAYFTSSLPCLTACHAADPQQGQAERRADGLELLCRHPGHHLYRLRHHRLHEEPRSKGGISGCWRIMTSTVRRGGVQSACPGFVAGAVCGARRLPCDITFHLVPLNCYGVMAEMRYRYQLRIHRLLLSNNLGDNQRAMTHTLPCCLLQTQKLPAAIPCNGS